MTNGNVSNVTHAALAAKINTPLKCSVCADIGSRCTNWITFDHCVTICWLTLNYYNLR